MLSKQQAYQRYLEGVVLAQSERIKAADAYLDEIADELQRVSFRFKTPGLADALTKIESLVRKAQSFEKAA